MKHKECIAEECVVHIIGDKKLIHIILQDAKARGLIKSFEMRYIVR